MMRLNHRSILRCEEVFSGEKNDRGEQLVNIVTQYCNGKNLDSLVKTVCHWLFLSRYPSHFDPLLLRFHRDQLSVLERGFAGFDLLDALHLMSSEHIVHRDLKPANILFHNVDGKRCLVIADFGMARVLRGGEVAREQFGTPLFNAPEILASDAYDCRSDIFSAGLPFLTCSVEQPYSASGLVMLCLYANMTTRELLDELHDEKAGDMARDNWSDFKDIVVRRLRQTSTPDQIINGILLMLAPSPEARPSPESLLRTMFNVRELRQNCRQQCAKYLYIPHFVFLLLLNCGCVCQARSCCCAALVVVDPVLPKMSGALHS